MERFKLVSAVHLFLIRDGKILLLRRFKTGYEDGKYSAVAGHLNGDEEIKAAAIREAQEEVGIDISPPDLQVVGVMHRKSTDERIDFFLATSSWSGEITNRESDKCDHLAWFDIDELPDGLIPYVRKALDNYRRGIWFDSFGWSSQDSTSPGIGQTSLSATFASCSVGQGCPTYEVSREGDGDQTVHHRL
jgi:8-oxo-dGTP diphosphatase